MPSIGDVLQIAGTIIALIAGLGALVEVRQKARKTRAEAAEIITHAAGEMVKQIEASLATVREELLEKKRLIEALETKIQSLERDMAEVKRQRTQLQKRQVELERGVRILIEQIRCLGHEPKYTLEDE